MTTSTIEMTWNGHVVIHWEGVLDAEGWAEVQRRWDLFKEGDTKTAADCRAKFDNPLNFAGFTRNDRYPFEAPVCNYPGEIK